MLETTVSELLKSQANKEKGGRQCQIVFLFITALSLSESHIYDKKQKE